MYSFEHYPVTPAEPIKDSIVQMVVDYATDLAGHGLAPSNPLYRLYQYVAGFEVQRYLDGMDGAQGSTAELWVATTDEGDLVGFALYLPVVNDPQACAVAFLAVHAAHRRRGIARQLLHRVTARYPHAELACNPAKVDIFAALGFRVLGARGPQVLMNTRDHATSGLIPLLDISPVYRSLEVRQIHAYLLKQHGRRAMLDAEKQRDRQLDRLEREAAARAQGH
jgi:GNAT superfamily N-acetyltransferase